MVNPCLIAKHHYTDSGLRNVWLANGYEVMPTKYGEGILIHNLAGLHRAIGLALCQKSHLTGAEFRFLRKEMEMSQRGLGELIGVTDQAVAKWEKQGNVPRNAEFLLQLLYLEKVISNVQIKETLTRILHTNRQQPVNFVAVLEAGTWTIQFHSKN